MTVETSTDRVFIQPVSWDALAAAHDQWLESVEWIHVGGVTYAPATEVRKNEATYRISRLEYALELIRAVFEEQGVLYRVQGLEDFARQVFEEHKRRAAV